MRWATIGRATTKARAATVRILVGIAVILVVTWLLRGLQPLEVELHLIEAQIPELPELLHIGAGLAERRGPETAGSPLGILAPHHQPGPLQHLEVLGDRGLRHAEWLGQRSDRENSRPEAIEHGPARRVRQGAEDGAQPVGGSQLSTVDVHSHWAIYSPSLNPPRAGARQASVWPTQSSPATARDRIP